MTDKQIIIDGIDVRKCVNRRWDNSQKIHLCYDSDTPLTSWGWCENNPNCYYKQLKRKEQECEELKKKIKGYQCNEKNTNRCTCAFKCLENAFCNEAENKIDEIQTKIKVLKIENEILSNKFVQEENWHKSADEISKVNSEYTVKLKQTLAEIKKLVEKEFCRHPECCEFCANSNDCLNQKIIEKINEVKE